MITKLIQLAWVKFDAEILCTLNESIQGYIIEANQCRNNPDIMFNFYLFEAAMITLKFAADVYFAIKLKQYVEEAMISECRSVEPS